MIPGIWRRARREGVIEEDAFGASYGIKRGTDPTRTTPAPTHPLPFDMFRLHHRPSLTPPTHPHSSHIYLPPINLCRGSSTLQSPLLLCKGLDRKAHPAAERRDRKGKEFGSGRQESCCLLCPVLSPSYPLCNPLDLAPKARAQTYQHFQTSFPKLCTLPVPQFLNSCAKHDLRLQRRLFPCLHHRTWRGGCWHDSIAPCERGRLSRDERRR